MMTSNGMSHRFTIFFLCRLDHKFGGCACSGGGGGASVWILPLQEKKLNLTNSEVLDPQWTKMDNN